MALLNKLTNKLKYTTPTVELFEIETKDIMTLSNGESSDSYKNNNAYEYQLDKKQKKNKSKNMPENYKELSELEIQQILDEHVTKLFPKTGEWSSSCYSGEGLQCHLRDCNYLADWFKDRLEAKNIYISKREVVNYIVNSSLFKKCRHDYELEIVKWQIKWMMNGGEGWLMPKSYGEFDMLYNPDVDKIFRASILKTLTAIGMNKDIVEEGIETHADLWREIYMSMAFNHAYGDRITFTRRTKLEPASEEHKENWLKLRRYEYYEDHHVAVNRYGSFHLDMGISGEELDNLKKVVEQQNAEREAVIQAWKEMKNDSKHYYEV